MPSEVQAKVRTYVAQKRRSSDASPPDVKSITVPISTFPPTAMVYNITKANVEKHSDDESDDSKPPVDIVSAAIMAKVLEDRERERIFAKHCNTCTCHRTIVMVDSETQTSLDRLDARLCDRCDSPELRNDQSVYEALNGTIHSSENSNDPMKFVNFRRLNETKLGANRARLDNAHLHGSLNSSDAQSRPARQTSALPKHGQHATKLKSSQSCTNDRAAISKNVNKTKQSRLIKRHESSAETRTPGTPDHWSKYENDVSPNDNHVDEKDTKANTSQKEPSPMDIINDRIWKSGWSSGRSHLNTVNERTDGRNRGSSSDTRIDVINDRVWKNDTSSTNSNRPLAQMTLIEVTNAVEVTSPKNSGQAETAASPSFSSDSVVISTSNQSSSSSDALHTINDSAKRLHNNNGTKSSWKDQQRAVGPRNCFMRVTPGSKNILLDNVGQYQTVLYTSGSNRPNTALVHVAKSTRSGRSMSTSSEENLPVVSSSDNTQLQRVAEWVQSSVGASKNTVVNNSREKTSRQSAPLLPTVGKSPDDTLVKIDIDESAESTSALIGVEENANLQEIIVPPIFQKSLDNPFSDATRNVENSNDLVDNVSRNEHAGDLITFDTCDKSREESAVSPDKIDSNYEVKITKEMEEIYLKLTASLDPVSLRLANPTGADLTIENYRKDHRKINVQKLQDKPK